MSTQVIEKDQVTSKGSLSAEQQKRAAAFAERERQHSSEAPVSTAQASGSGTTNYSITMTDDGSGFARLAWGAVNTLGQYVIAASDWVGVFANYNQALVNPNSHYLGGSGGWTWASGGGPFTTDVVLQNGYVTAYIIKNAGGNYVPVAISQPYLG